MELSIPKFKDQEHIRIMGRYDNSTAEVPLTNYYREEVIPTDLPVYFTALSAILRSEAGSAGQYSWLDTYANCKIEMVKYTKPEDSYNR